MSSPEPSPEPPSPSSGDATNTSPTDSAPATITTLTSGLASSAFGAPNNHGVTLLSLPGEGVFDSWEELFSATQNHAKLAGYALVQGRGSERRKDKGNRWTKFLICKHGRAYRQEIEEPYRKRPNRTTRKTDCMVRMKVQERPNGTWTLHHLQTQHNHPASNPASYPEHRQLSATQKQVLVANHTAGVPTNRIKRSLKTANPALEITSRDLYNQTAKLARDLRQGQPPNEALIQELSEAKARGELYFEYSLNDGTHEDDSDEDEEEAAANSQVNLVAKEPDNRIMKMFFADMRYVYRIELNTN
jgi:hypothetical protein